MDDGVGVEIVEGSGDLTSVVGYRTAVQGTESAREDLVQVGYIICVHSVSTCNYACM